MRCHITHLPPEGDAEEAGESQDQQQRSPISYEEGNQRKNHVADGKEDTYSHGGVYYPNRLA